MLDFLEIPGLKPIDFRMDRGTLVIEAAILEEPARPNCPTCNKPMGRHTSRKQTYDDVLPSTMKPVKLELSVPRFYCKRCHKAEQSDLPFLDEKRAMVRRLMGHIHNRCLETPFRRLAGEMGLPVNTVRNIALDLITDLDSAVNPGAPSHLGIADLPTMLGKHLALFNLGAYTLVDILEAGARPELLRRLQRALDADEVEWVCIGPTSLPLTAIRRCFPRADFVDCRHGEVNEYRGFRRRLALGMSKAIADMKTIAEHFDSRCKFRIMRGRLLYSPQARESSKQFLVAGVRSREADFGASVEGLVGLAKQAAFDEDRSMGGKQMPRNTKKGLKESIELTPEQDGLWVKAFEDYANNGFTSMYSPRRK